MIHYTELFRLILEKNSIEINYLARVLGVDMKVLAGVLEKIQGVKIIDRKVVVEDKIGVIQSGLLMGAQPNVLFRYVDWREFEKKVSEIMEKHGYSIIYNFYGRDKKSNKRFQIDIIGINVPNILVIDTKHWSYKTTVRSRIEQEIQKHYERTRLLSENNEFTTILYNFLKNTRTKTVRFYPVIITLSPKYKYIGDKCFVVPLNYLSDFVYSFPQLREEIEPIEKKVRR